MNKFAADQDAAEAFDQYIQDQLTLAQREHGIKVQTIMAEKEKYLLSRKKKEATDAVREEDKAIKEQEKQKKDAEKAQLQQQKELQQQAELPYPSIGGVQSQGTNALADPNAMAQLQKTSSSAVSKVIHALRMKRGLRSKQ